MNNVQTHIMATTVAAVAPLPSQLGIERMEVDVQDDNDEAADEDADDDNSDSSSSSSSSDSSDEASSDSSTTTSSESDETQQGNVLELAQITHEIVQLPRELCEYENVFREFFTEELWTELSVEQRTRLQSQLPDFTALLEPNEAIAEQRHTVHLLFQDKLQRFGRTPLGELHRNLEAGHYRPDIKVWRESIAKSQRREQRFRECERLGVLAKRLFIAREHLLRSAYSSAPDEVLRLERTLQKQQQHHSFLFNSDTTISAVRARKRFYMEMSELKKQAHLPTSSDVLSADEEDKDEEDSLAHLAQEWLTEEMTTLKSAASMTSSTDKCIYDTFFKRRPNFTDEESMRLSQYAKRPKLTHRSYRQYLLDYKRKKLIEPNLPDYETADIRLRDVCARAQISGNFKRSFPLGQKPGRKGKVKLNEPPALVPIKQESTSVKSANEIMQNSKLDALRLQQQKQQKQVFLTAPSNQINVSHFINENVTQNDAFNVYEGEVEVQQEEVETYAEETLPTGCIVSNEAIVPPATTAVRVMPTNTTTVIRALPKLEPIVQRNISVVQSKDKTKTPMKTGINTLNTVNKKLSIPPLEPTPFVAHANHSSELIQETHACFFALIRDFFCATPNHRMKFDELKQRIQIWLSNPITALNDWYARSNNWAALLTSAIKFLAGDFVEQPEEYVPYIDFKAQLNIYQWIGAGRDSDARLVALCNYWMDHRKDMHAVKPAQSQQQRQQVQQLRLNVVRSNPTTVVHTEAVNDIVQANTQMNNSNVVATTIISPSNSNNSTSTSTPATPPPPPRCPTTWTVRPATAEEMHEFQRQERARFEQPHRAYTYRMHGYESIVGPVRGIYSQTLALTKARGHSMMVDDRPNFVTILTLVRDATARLPNGEGTRADISELLKCSQYINPDAAENVMQTIVSGALDRLHTESDPCVRYDPKRKIWIYLHRNRTEVEFERMHQQQQGQPKPNKLIKTTTSTVDVTRKVLPKTVIKSLPVREGSTQVLNNMTLPALVPANPILITTQAATANNKQQQPALPKHALPVPPLKYNIPSSTILQQQQQQQQKSLLKSTINPQRRVVDAKTGSTVLTTGTSVPQKSFQSTKQLSFSLPQGSKLVTASTNATTKAPIFVTTSSGVQTLHVPPNALPIGTTSTTNPATASLTATVAGKRVALSKPIIINQISSKTQQQQQQQQNQQQITTINRGNATQIITTKPQQQLQKQQTTQGFIIPINAANANMQLQLQQQLLQGNAAAISPTRTTSTHKSGVHTIVVDPNATTFATINNAAATTDASKSTPKNIIRFVPNVKQQQQQHSPQIITNKLIGQRVVAPSSTLNSTSNTNANVTMRGATKILNTVINSNASPVLGNSQATTTLLPNNATIVSTSTVGGAGSLPGTIIKMSPQAFTALQQKQQQQQLQHIVKTSGASVSVTPTQQQRQQQQRLIIGNTAIIAHGTGNTNVGKNTTISQQQLQQSATQTTAKALSSSTIITNTKAIDVANSTTLTTPSNTGKVQMLNATNLTPQQQRVLIQNFKQQQQNNMTTKPLAVVVSQTPTGITRVLKTTTASMGASTTTTATKIINTATGAAGQIVTLDSLLQHQQQQQQQQHLNSTVDSNSGTIITPISAAQFSNLIALGGTTQQRLITTQATSNATNVITGATTTAGGNLRVIQTSSSGAGGVTTGNTGPTTFSIANIQGKQVVFASKAPANSKQVTNIGQMISTGSGTGNVIFGGQTLKLQGNQLQNLTKTSGGIATASSGNINSTSNAQAPQMQTVIMGNQILRVLPQSLVAAKNTAKSETTTTLQSRVVAVGSNTNKISTGTTTVGTSTSLPKTLVLGSSSSGTQTIRLQTSAAVASQQNSTQATSQKATTTATGNRVVLAVQGGGQILLPSNFTTGGTLNLKSLQNMKLVSLTQMPQQLQDKSKTSVTNNANSPKTVVKTIGNNNGTAIG